jgi:hypothetical protein
MPSNRWLQARDGIAAHIARVHPDRGKDKEYRGQQKRDHVTEAEIQQADLEPAPAIFLSMFRQLRAFDTKIRFPCLESVERPGEALFFHLPTQQAHADFLGFAPLGGLQRHVDARWQQPEE